LFNENHPYNPYKNYGKSKMLAEKYVNRMFREGKINTTIIRPCWFYGPNQPLRQTTFFKMIKKGNPLVFGDGNNLRSMSYVDNIVQAMILASQSEKANGQTYWIADERPYPTIEIYQTVADQNQCHQRKNMSQSVLKIGVNLSIVHLNFYNL